MKKKSQQHHMLQGTFRPDRHARNPLRFRTASTTAPRYLSRVAREEWRRIAPMLAEAGALTEVDLPLLGAYCTAYGNYRDALSLIAKQGQVITVTSTTRTGQTSKPVRNPAVGLAAENAKIMLQISSRFGFTPLDRERISGIDVPASSQQVPGSEDDDIRDYSWPDGDLEAEKDLYPDT